MDDPRPTPSVWDLPVVDPDRVIFWSGAGISVDAPTNGPIGLELTRRALNYAFVDEAVEELRETYAAVLEAPDARELPRLEAVLEIATHVHGTGALAALLADLAQAEPNPLHQFFNEHLARGGRHVTANFDTLIERGGDAEVHPLHFHGALDGGPRQYEHLGARLSRLERGFDPGVRDGMRDVLVGTAKPTIVVVGYSGLDFFDVDPFVASIAVELAVADAHVLWMNHNPGATSGLLTTVDADAWSPPMVRTLLAAGVRVTTVSGTTTSLLNAFATQWQMPTLVPQRPSSPRASLQPLPHQRRAEATRRLYLHMGMFRAHKRLTGQFEFLRQNVDAATRAEIAWQRGQYRQARSNWDEVYAGDSPATTSRRWERRAAVQWVRGAYMRAYLLSRRSIRIALTSANPDVIAVAFETHARIMVHIARTTDLKWFSTDARRHRLAKRIEELSSGTPFGAHLDVRLRDVRALLRDDPGRMAGLGSLSREAPQGAETFNQYESLAAALDFRRGAKRSRVSAGIEPMTQEWLDAYRRAAGVLGMDAGIRTLPTLPGAPAHYSAFEGVRLLVTVQATVWHRLRLVTRFLLARG